MDGDCGALHCHHYFAACATCPGSWWWVVATAEHIFAAVMSFPFNDLKQTRRGRAAPRQAALGLNTGVLLYISTEDTAHWEYVGTCFSMLVAGTTVVN